MDFLIEFMIKSKYSGGQQGHRKVWKFGGARSNVVGKICPLR